MSWTIFAAIDLWMGIFLLNAMSSTVPPEKLPRLRKVRRVILVLLVISIVVLLVQIARRYGWFGR